MGRTCACGAVPTGAGFSATHRPGAPLEVRRPIASHQRTGPWRLDEDGAGRQADFGQRWIVEEKDAVKGVHRVASEYDIMNDFMSAGVHRVWKDNLSRAPADKFPKMLGVAGTGDIAFRAIDYVRRYEREVDGKPFVWYATTTRPCWKRARKGGRTRVPGQGRTLGAVVQGDAEAPQGQHV